MLGRRRMGGAPDFHSESREEKEQDDAQYDLLLLGQILHGPSILVCWLAMGF